MTSLHAHGFGLAWYEQKRDNKGNISFVTHMIMDDFATQNAGGLTFTELHGATCADMDGDGIPDFITGKRFIRKTMSSTPIRRAPQCFMLTTRFGIRARQEGGSCQS